MSLEAQAGSAAELAMAKELSEAAINAAEVRARAG
jgi:hypothetical protein